MSDKGAILGILSREDLYGYEISKRIKTIEGFWYIFPGNLYKALDSLLREKLIEIKKKEEHKGRMRKVYRITEKGRKEFEKWLREPGTMPKTRHEPFLKIWFSLSEPESVITQLNAIRSNAAGLLNTLKQLDFTSAPEYIKWMMQSGREHAELDLKWSESCLRKMSERRSKTGGKRNDTE